MSETVPRHQLTLRKPYSKFIAEGIKTVEVRVGYPKIRKIQAGHELAFVAVSRTSAEEWPLRRQSVQKVLVTGPHRAG
jgi:ASC-1-like (ASCH) protein